MGTVSGSREPEKGTGRVVVSFGSTRELDAVTDGEALPTGASVRVKAVLNGSPCL